MSSCSSSRVLKIVTGALQRISWDDFCINASMLADVASVVNNVRADHPSFVFMAFVLQKVNWAKTEMGVAMDGNAYSLSSLYATLMTIFLTMLGKISLTSEFAQFLQQIAPTFPWHHISVEQYTVVLTTCGDLVNASGDVQAKARSVLVMRLIRNAAAMMLDTYDEARCFSALEKGSHYAILMRSALESLAPVLKSDAHSANGDDGGIAAKEAAALPFAPYNFIQLYYEFMREVEACVGCYQQATGLAFVDPVNCPAPLVGIVCQLVSLLNLPGVPFLDPRRGPASAGQSILDQIDSLLTTVGVMPPGEHRASH